MSDAMDRAALGRQLLHANGPVADHEWASVGAALARENERLREALSRLSAASLDQLPGEAVRMQIENQRLHELVASKSDPCPYCGERVNELEDTP